MKSESESEQNCVFFVANGRLFLTRRDKRVTLTSTAFSFLTMLLPLGRKETETASTLPEASTSYEPLLKKELGHRILAISLAFLAFEYLLYLIPSLDISRGQQLGLLPHLAVTAVFALVTFAFGALPLLALRGRTLSGPE